MSTSIRLNPRKARFVILLAAVLALASCRTDTATGPATTGRNCYRWRKCLEPESFLNRGWGLIPGSALPKLGD
jgi:hypothetical protein